MARGSWCQRVTLWPVSKTSLRQDGDETSTIWPSLLYPCPCIITRPILYAGQQFNGKKRNKTTEPPKARLVLRKVGCYFLSISIAVLLTH